MAAATGRGWRGRPARRTGASASLPTGRCLLSVLEAVAIVAAGLGAGMINTIVGSGTLLTFPTLLAVGYSPIVANVSNTIGLVPGVASGVYGYRTELRGQRARLLRLG